MMWIVWGLTAWARPQLNRASVDDLDAVEGVDRAVAERIVALRGERGRLGSVEELRILGLGEDTLAALRSGVDVDLRIVPDAQVGSFQSADDVLSRFSGEPTIQQVQQWAGDYAGTNPATVERWLRASRTFAALPQLTLEYQFTDGFDQDFVYLTVDGATVQVPDDELFPGLTDGGRDQQMDFLVRTRWDLNELVMSSERIRVIGEAQDVAKLRDKVLSEVTRLYFERRRLQVEQLLSPKSDLMGQLKDHLRLAELTADLDATTGGRFSARAGDGGKKRD